MQSLSARCVAGIALALLASGLFAETSRAKFWQSVLDQLYQGQPVLALQKAESCAAQNVFCAKYVEVQLWAMTADPETAEHVQGLMKRHSSTFATALQNEMPDAVILDTWRKVNALAFNDPAKAELLDRLQPMLDDENALAWYVAGLLRTYENGEVASRDGLHYFIHASELGVRDAMVKAAQVFACRICAGQPDDVQAYYWLNQAIVLQYAPAMTEMGSWLRRGYVWRKNVQQAEANLKQAWQLGDPNALCEQGKMALHGDGMTVDRIKATRLFKNGSAAGASRCATYQAEAYKNNWLVRTGDDNETAYYRQCALEGNAKCAAQWGHEVLTANASRPIVENPGVDFLASLAPVQIDAAKSLGDFFRFRSEPGSARRAYTAYRQAELMGSDYARYKMVTLLIDHEEEFTNDELSRLPELFESTLSDYRDGGFSYPQSQFYARGIYHERDPEQARRWLWAALYGSSENSRQKLLDLAEAEASFVDDETLKWAYRELIGVPTSLQSKIDYYIDRLQNGHTLQKAVAYREVLAIEKTGAFKDKINVAFALASSDPKIPEAYDAKQFELTTQTLLDSSTSQISAELYYALGMRAHINTYAIENHELAKKLLERSDERANGLLVRLYANKKFGMADEKQVKEKLASLAESQTNYNGGFYRELGGYAKKVKRLDLADVFYQRSLLTGDAQAKSELNRILEDLAQQGGRNYRKNLLSQLQAATDVSRSPDEQAMALFFAANRLQFSDLQDKEALTVVVSIYDQLLEHSNSTVQVLVHDAYSGLYYLNNAVLRFNPDEERKHLRYCIDQPICEDDRVFRLAVNLVQYPPTDPALAKKLIEEHKGTSSNALSQRLEYYATVDDAEQWWETLLTSSDYQRDENLFFYYARHRPASVTHDDIWAKIFTYKKPLKGHAYSLRAMMDDYALLPTNEEEREQMKMLLKGSDFSDAEQAYMMGGGL